MGLRTGIGREAKHRREMQLEKEREWGGKRIEDGDWDGVEEGKRKLGFLRKQEEVEEEEDNMVIVMVLLNRGATALSITCSLFFGSGFWLLSLLRTCNLHDTFQDSFLIVFALQLTLWVNNQFCPYFLGWNSSVEG